jgi:hypothetical protein
MPAAPGCSRWYADGVDSGWAPDNGWTPVSKAELQVAVSMGNCGSVAMHHLKQHFQLCFTGKMGSLIGSMFRPLGILKNTKLTTTIMLRAGIRRGCVGGNIW